MMITATRNNFYQAPSVRQNQVKNSIAFKGGIEATTQIIENLLKNPAIPDVISAVRQEKNIWGNYNLKERITSQLTKGTRDEAWARLLDCQRRLEKFRNDFRNTEDKFLTLDPEKKLGLIKNKIQITFNKTKINDEIEGLVISLENPLNELKSKKTLYPVLSKRYEKMGFNPAEIKLLSLFDYFGQKGKEAEMLKISENIENNLFAITHTAFYI